MMVLCVFVLKFFFFNDTATTEIYTLSLHDALPICARGKGCGGRRRAPKARSSCASPRAPARGSRDRKSTRLNSSHLVISYAVFCLKKNNTHTDYVESNSLDVLAAYTFSKHYSDSTP